MSKMKSTRKSVFVMTVFPSSVTAGMTRTKSWTNNPAKNAKPRRWLQIFIVSLCSKNKLLMQSRKFNRLRYPESKKINIEGQFIEPNTIS